MSLRRASALALSTTAVVGGLLVLGAVLLAPAEVRAPVAWGGGVAALLLAAAVTAAVHATLRVRALAGVLARGQEDADRFIGETLPQLVTRLRAGDSASTALNTATRGLGDLDNPNARALLDILATEVGRGEAARAAAMSACANAAGRMQALATGMLADLREMEHRHSDEDVLGDLLHLDHRTAQAGRLADSIAVLTGARSGRRWAKPIVMESVLRGAMGRINGYQRVRLHSTSEVAVAGHAAEGVMHALAELLDNAANFSPPTAEVHVYVEEVPAGVIITVEDSGLVMSDVQLRRAERAVCAETPLDLTSLSGTRLGLAVVGCLARKHNLTVSFRPSARGGTGALMLLPQELLTQVVPQVPVAPVPVQAAPVPVRAVAPAPVAAPGADDVVREEPTTLPVRRREHARAEAPQAVVPARPSEHVLPAEVAAAPEQGSDTTGGLPQFGESGLPKRKRGRTLAAAHPDGPQAPARPAPGAAARRDAANRFSTFRQAVQGRADAPGEGGVDSSSGP
ncbi:histidine kinase [Streptomyces spiroverticillatus]|uniref:histidine kinase n=1 Tax=Streptomyces finlayi TaxID=67296 RepID=A0A918X1C3_9ACTN|nr:ATP-binding protein [Streptomyces finlayi]GHA20454.1 histidine kinase [Streptomyces spiroverticillatus]GHD03207.1 histidine kinase [Streptomyces finlayi]